MASYVPPIKNGASGWIGYVQLSPRTPTGQFQANPTLAAGDVKVSIDGGALANLGTLPAVTPASSTWVKVTLSQAEVNGDNIAVQFIDAAGAEWCDLGFILQTVARAIDDLAYPTVSGRSLDVSAAGEAGIDWANIGSPTTAQNLSGTNIDVDQIVASVSGAVGSVTGAVGSVTGLTASNLDTTISSRASAASLATAQTSIDDIPTNAELATALGTADDATLAAIAALNNPSAGTIASAVWDLDATAHQTQGTFGQAIGDPVADANTIYKAVVTDADGATVGVDVTNLPTNAELTTALGTADDAVLAQVALVKAQTDSLTFTVAGKVDANIKYVTDIQVDGNGQDSNPWGPV